MGRFLTSKRGQLTAASNPSEETRNLCRFSAGQEQCGNQHIADNDHRQHRSFVFVLSGLRRFLPRCPFRSARRGPFAANLSETCSAPASLAFGARRPEPVVCDVDHQGRQLLVIGDDDMPLDGR